MNPFLTKEAITIVCNLCPRLIRFWTTPTIEEISNRGFRYWATEEDGSFCCTCSECNEEMKQITQGTFFENELTREVKNVIVKKEEEDKYSNHPNDIFFERIK